MKCAILLTVVLFCLPAIAFGQSPDAKAEALLRREMRERRIPGLQAAVVKDGKIVLLTSLGAADLQTVIPITNKSVFGIYSCTKAFTGVAIAQLVEDGKLDLSAPVSRYLDGLPDAWQPVTIRQLLTHVSGLPNILRALDPVAYGFVNGSDEETAWTKTKAMPMEFTPGERFSYNQTNYALLGKIIDKLSRKPFAQVFRERQFDVAAMSHTGFGDSRDITPNMVRTYRYVSQSDGQKLSAEKLVHDYAEFPAFRRTASGMNSTAEDLARWIINELKRKNPTFDPLERDLNDWAYRMLNGGGKPKEALEISN